MSTSRQDSVTPGAIAYRDHGIRARGSRSSLSGRIGTVGLLCFLCVAAVLYILPFYWMVVSSLKPQSELFRWPPTLLPQRLTFEHYTRVFTVIPLGRAYWNTFYIAVIRVVSQVTLCSLAGYVFEKLRFPLREAMFTAILFTLIIPFQSQMVPLFLFFSTLGLVDNHLAIILPNLLTAFAIFFFRQNIKSVPNDLLDSAKLDGCSALGRYFRIVLPLIKAAIGTIIIFAFLQSWNDFLWPVIILNTRRQMVLEQVLSILTHALGAEEEGTRMAAATLAVLPILAIFFSAQRYFVRGIALTGLK